MIELSANLQWLWIVLIVIGGIECCKELVRRIIDWILERREERND